MPCLLVVFALITPRLVLVLVWLFSHYLDRAFHTLLWPLLGFIFMPLTTLAWAFAVNAGGSPHGIYLLLVILAALIDLSSGFGGLMRRR